MKIIRNLISVFLLIFFSPMLSAEGIKGINYDPAHSQVYIDAQNRNDLPAMEVEIRKDLKQIHDLQFFAIKTFYSQYCTISGQGCISIAQLAQGFGLKVALGVFEFGAKGNGERAWTKSQVEAAITAAQTYPDTVTSIVVGNEDLGQTYGENQLIDDAIVEDITYIKKTLNNAIPVGTAQQSVVLDPNSPINFGKLPDSISKIIQVSDFIGITVYPFWALIFPNDANDVTKVVTSFKASFPDKTIMVAEEGWPTGGTIPTATQAEQNKYFNAWINRSDNFESYYFTMYDKIPGLDATMPKDSADNFFGLCTVKGESKDGSIFKCKLGQ